jgi:hypothetical protein
MGPEFLEDLDILEAVGASLGQDRHGNLVPEKDLKDLAGHLIFFIFRIVRIPNKREKDLLMELLFGELLFEELDQMGSRFGSPKIGV